MLLLTLLTACTPKINVFKTDGLQWTSFQWYPATMGGRLFEKAAILVQLHLDGQEEGNLWMQLDTGAWNTVFYERPFQLLDSSTYQVKRTTASRPSLVEYDGSIGELPINQGRAMIMHNYGGQYTVLQGDVQFGTIGLDMFDKKVLVLDFPNQRLSVLNSTSQLPPEIASKTNYIPAELVNGRFVVHASVGPQDLELFYDTGASTFPLQVQPSLWPNLTGRTGDEPDNDRYSGPAWGNTLDVVGAPLSDELQFGSYKFSGLMTYFVPDPNWNLRVMSKSDGLIGNALFYDDYTVILDLKDMRFGFAKTSGK